MKSAISSQGAGLAPHRIVYSVTRLNNEVRAVLSGAFPLLWVEGEISNLARPRSGHLYFSLKDSNAQVRCAMFRMRRQALRFQPEEGMQVRARVQVNLYQPRGEYQLSVESMEPAGEGALNQVVEQLKAKLANEGLFDARLKKRVPPFPHQVGVVTSPTGAAFHDVLTVLRRRFPGLPVVLYPVVVQGAGAAAALVEMIGIADQRGECDLLIVGRGGGSLEDLMAFNDEGVARAIAAASTPVVSAVGHEVDFTIADLVADLRAPTPSAAAEMISPDREELAVTLAGSARRLDGAIQRRLERHTTGLQHLAGRLERQQPAQRLKQNRQRLDELELRLLLAWNTRKRHWDEGLQGAEKRLAAASPRYHLGEARRQMVALGERLRRAMEVESKARQEHLQALARELNAVSPLAVLGRGYSITVRASDGEVVREARALAIGERVVTRLQGGEVVSLVESLKQA